MTDCEKLTESQSSGQCLSHDPDVVSLAMANLKQRDSGKVHNWTADPEGAIKLLHLSKRPKMLYVSALNMNFYNTYIE